MTEYRVISTKITSGELERIKKHCSKKGIKPYQLIKDLLMQEVEVAVPAQNAGANQIEYNKDKDNFTWIIVLDSGERVQVVKHLSPEYLQDLSSKLNQALTTRQEGLKKTRRDSVPVPSSMLRKKK